MVYILPQPSVLATTSHHETDSVGSAETVRLHFSNPEGKTGNSAKNAVAWFDDDISDATSQVWLQAHNYLHWYNAFTFTSGDVNTTTDRATATSHGLPSSPGWKGQLTTTGTLPTGLSLATSYYAKRIDANTVEFYTDAALTAKVDITAVGSGTHTFTPDNTYFNNQHRHFSIEVSNSDLANKNTRFSIPWGYDTTEIGFFQSNVNVNGGKFRITGSSGSYRQLQFANTLSDNLVPDGTEGRWAVQADSTAESGSNAGSDFRITRFNDSGVALDAPLFVKRSNGNVGVQTTAPGTTFDVGAGTGSYEARVNRGSNASFLATLALATSGTDRWALQLRNDSTNDLHIRNSAQGFTALLVEDRATAPNISLLTGTKSYGGGVGVVFVANASTVPASNPTGGVVLYVSGGRLKIRQPDGTDMFVSLSAT
ncbi:hypothetical protein [Streptomyces yerevanensis]|uniref:hypothetical protein n=1 Tax=Streptomyces yerevanensis TaxID=66378 RepID=UPI0006908A0D|nr:hypothetical protein [Streptomyces yerevanensis]